MNQQEWTECRIQKLIDNQVTESINLEYKGSGALSKSDGKKKEISKDVSAFANSAGGTIIYGVKEYDEEDKKHLPEKIDGGVDPSELSREWLEQVINSNIQPVIDGLLIHQVELVKLVKTNPANVAYVVEIPQSERAPHQASDKKYYKRYNFQSVPMEDYEVKDVMNRVKVPVIEPIFSHQAVERTSDAHTYDLQIFLKNKGKIMVRNFYLQVTFPSSLIKYISNLDYKSLLLDDRYDERYREISINSYRVLFPEERFHVTEGLRYIRYEVNTESHHEICKYPELMKLKWALYADNMPPKRGEIPLSDRRLNGF